MITLVWKLTSFYYWNMTSFLSGYYWALNGHYLSYVFVAAQEIEDSSKTTSSIENNQLKCPKANHLQ